MAPDKIGYLRYPIVKMKEEETPTLGAAILASVKTGDYNTIDEAVKKMVKKSKRFRPNNENASAYIENYQLYNDLYDNLASVYKRYGIQNEL